ncbi:MAG: hypothetical protein QM778_24700 [Myxococcales bacterium]
MRRPAQIALLLALMGAFGCAQGAATPNGEVGPYDDIDAGDEGDGDGDSENTGDGDGDGDSTGDGDGDGDVTPAGDGDGDGDGDATGTPDAGTGGSSGSNPLGSIGDIFNQLIGAITGMPPAGGADAGP